MKQHQQLAQKASTETYLSENARHFIRLNPSAAESQLALSALEYMDDCYAEIEEDAATELEKETDIAEKKGEEFALDQFRELLDAAMCLYDESLKEKSSKKDRDAYQAELFAAALKCEKYRKNLEDK